MKRRHARSLARRLWFGTADAQSAAAHTRRVAPRETYEEFEARVEKLKDANDRHAKAAKAVTA